jgi:hypothetical protein
MKKALLLAVPLLVLLSGGAQAQSAKTCVNQYAEASGVTPATLITGGFEIKAATVNGLWLQKSKETYYCNTGRVPDGQSICWTLRVPVTGQPCE